MAASPAVKQACQQMANNRPFVGRL
jgi:hypothetical protein